MYGKLTNRPFSVELQGNSSIKAIMWGWLCVCVCVCKVGRWLALGRHRNPSESKCVYQAESSGYFLHVSSAALSPRVSRSNGTTESQTSSLSNGVCVEEGVKVWKISKRPSKPRCQLDLLTQQYWSGHWEPILLLNADMKMAFAAFSSDFSFQKNKKSIIEVFYSGRLFLYSQ